jgi:uncharacterized protein YabN with tetrapyrrole methylase and pyrophosphatase domain
MTIFPHLVKEVIDNYGKMSRARPQPFHENEREDLRDIVSISMEAKRRQILDQAKTEVLERIRETGHDGEKRI